MYKPQALHHSPSTAPSQGVIRFFPSFSGLGNRSHTVAPPSPPSFHAISPTLFVAPASNMIVNQPWKPNPTPLETPSFNLLMKRAFNAPSFEFAQKTNPEPQKLADNMFRLPSTLSAKRLAPAVQINLSPHATNQAAVSLFPLKRTIPDACQEGRRKVQRLSEPEYTTNSDPLEQELYVKRSRTDGLDCNDMNGKTQYTDKER